MIQQQKSLKFVKYFIVFFLITVFVLLLSFTGLFSPVEGFLGKLTSPIVSFFDSTSLKIQDTIKSISELGNLQKENKDLGEKVKELTKEIIALKELKIENESLKKQLGFIESTNYQSLVAKVIAKEPSNFLKAIVINRGSKDGIKKNMAVLSDGFLVGKVLEVNTSTSKVILLTDSNFEVNGMIQESQAIGLVRGQIGSGLVMETISKEKNIAIDNTVVTSNLESNIPEGLPIGKITEIGQEGSGLFQKASLTPFINLDEIRNVVLILGFR